MKKILLLLAFCTSALIGSAQDFGKTLVTGSIGYSSSKNETEYNGSYNYAGTDLKQHTFTVIPQIGFFVSPRWALGASIGYTLLKTDNTPYSSDPSLGGSYTNTKSQTFTVGPFVRYYQPVSEKAAFFGQTTIGYQHNKSEYENINSNNTISTNEQTYKGAIANIMPGFIFFPSDKVGLELTLGSIGYQRYKQEQDNSESSRKYSQFDIGFGLENVNIGVSLYLGRTASE